MWSKTVKTPLETTQTHSERFKTVNTYVLAWIWDIFFVLLQLYIVFQWFDQKLYQLKIEGAIFAKKWLSVIPDFLFFADELRISEKQQHCRVGRQRSIAAIFFSKFFHLDIFWTRSRRRKIAIFRKVFWGKKVKPENNML